MSTVPTDTPFSLAVIFRIRPPLTPQARSDYGLMQQGIRSIFGNLKEREEQRRHSQGDRDRAGRYPALTVHRSSTRLMVVRKGGPLEV